MTVEMEMNQKQRQQPMTFMGFFTRGQFDDGAQLFNGGLMASLAGVIVSALGHSIFANGMGMQMIDLVPLMIFFVLGGLLLVPVAALFQVLLKEGAVGVFSLCMLFIILSPLVLGVRHGLYTSTISGWTFGMVYASVFTFAILAATGVFLQFGRRL